VGRPSYRGPSWSRTATHASNADDVPNVREIQEESSRRDVSRRAGESSRAPSAFLPGPSASRLPHIAVTYREAAAAPGIIRSVRISQMALERGAPPGRFPPNRPTAGRSARWISRSTFLHLLSPPLDPRKKSLTDTSRGRILRAQWLQGRGGPLSSDRRCRTGTVQAAFRHISLTTITTSRRRGDR